MWKEKNNRRYWAFFKDDDLYTLVAHRSHRKIHNTTKEKAELLIAALQFCKKNSYVPFSKYDKNMYKKTKNEGYVIEPTTEQLQLIQELTECLNKNEQKNSTI